MNFEKLQDILLKRKGMKLDVESSKALADSLDRCIVSLLLLMKFLALITFLRILLNLHLTPLFESWQLDACFLLNISVLEACQRIHSVIMDWPATYTRISPVPFVAMQVISTSSLIDFID
jgi:hypothetical protein